MTTDFIRADRGENPELKRLRTGTLLSLKLLPEIRHLTDGYRGEVIDTLELLRVGQNRIEIALPERDIGACPIAMDPIGQHRLDALSNPCRGLGFGGPDRLENPGDVAKLDGLDRHLADHPKNAYCSIVVCGLDPARL
jgi:hypothetical protein